MHGPFSIYFTYRRLDGTNDTDIVIDTDDENPGNSSDTDTGGGDAEQGISFQDQLMAYEKFGIIFLVVVVLFLLCCTWRCCKRRRERRNLQLDSARADNVLGDMAMVPTDEVDEDAELI